MWLVATILNDAEGSFPPWPLERGRGMPQSTQLGDAESGVWTRFLVVFSCIMQSFNFGHHSLNLNGDIHILLPKHLGKSR